KFAIINDIHNGPPGSGFKNGIERKLTQKAEPLVKKFVENMNQAEHLEFVIVLGDFIEDVNNRDIDIDYFNKTCNLLSALKMPTHYMIGNHDVRTLSEDDIKKIINYERLYYTFDKGDYHFICLSFEMIGNHTKVLSDIRAEVSEEQREWLKNDLSQTHKPTIVCIHYGLAEDDMKGNFWFESGSHNALLDNRTEVKQILERSGKVKAVISGHQHWNRMKVENGIPYFVVTSLVENFNNDGIAAEAYTMITLNNRNIIVDVKGNDPALFEFNFQ
ncbi:MAG TPA: metallophosphoesterase, partial [Candidatus Nitrosocosmicus sp.]|nr:metallophosphoesterase [Candidatus Nitrosocosmicus sp.]